MKKTTTVDFVVLHEKVFFVDQTRIYAMIFPEVFQVYF